MSTLEKAILLLQEMPDQTLEAAYNFLQAISAQQAGPAIPDTVFGIAHKYATPALIEKEGDAARYPVR